MTNLPDAYDRLVAALIKHQRAGVALCNCGWGVKFGHWGKSHARHVADEFFFGDEYRGA